MIILLKLSCECFGLYTGKCYPSLGLGSSCFHSLSADFAVQQLQDKRVSSQDKGFHLASL